jgi:hypothetical protein
LTDEKKDWIDETGLMKFWTGAWNPFATISLPVTSLPFFAPLR